MEEEETKLRESIKKLQDSINLLDVKGACDAVDNLVSIESKFLLKIQNTNEKADRENYTNVYKTHEEELKKKFESQSKMENSGLMKQAIYDDLIYIGVEQSLATEITNVANNTKEARKMYKRYMEGEIPMKLNKIK